MGRYICSRKQTRLDSQLYAVDVSHKCTSRELKCRLCVYLVVFSTGEESVSKFGSLFAKFTTSEAEERLRFREVHFYYFCF